MAKTYEAIASQTVNGSSTITFSSIPSTFTDLVLVMTGSHSSPSIASGIRFGNGSLDTGANYSWTDLYGDGSTAGYVRVSNSNEIYFAGMGNIQSMSCATIFSYTNTNVYKTVLVHDSRPSSYVQLFSGLWRSTSAIDTLTVFTASGNFTSGTTFSLYGIKAA